MRTRRFPPDFLLGCATAAHQVEGHTTNDWSRWERDHPDRVAGGATAEVACDHYARFREDFAQLAAASHSGHRLSVEWSRVEPTPGRFDRAALRHYGEVVRTMRGWGIEPIVTLHHFTFPRWLADHGGARSAEAPRVFARFAAACAETFGDSVRWWITVNEPNVLAFMGHLTGAWPPGEVSMSGALATLRGLALMHAAAYRALHTVARRRGWPAEVSIAHAERRLFAKRPRSALDRAAAALPDLVFNRCFLRSCQHGRLMPPLGAGETAPGLRDSLDYLGVNYYCDDVVAFDAGQWRSLFGRREPDARFPLSSFGWAINPPGLRRAVNDLWSEFGLPIIVTENGVADEDDELRPAYLVDHLNALLDAIEDGVDLRGYMHWTAWDNFEWAEGYTKRFGMYAVDPVTLSRVPKPSAALFAGICATREVPAAASRHRRTIEPAGARI